MKNRDQRPTLIFKRVKPLTRKTNQLNSLFRAQMVIEAPGHKRLRTTINLKAQPIIIPAPAELYANNERGRPKKLIAHATLIAEYHYLLHHGKKKLDAREALARKHGYSNERAVRRVTNDARWEASHWCVAVQTGSIHKPALVALLDRNRTGTVWGINGQVIALSGTGWLWIERQKSAIWLPKIEVQAKDCENLYPTLFTDAQYVLERLTKL
jgi:hypothetical protein